ncbi:hypothetical protein [Maridesulfovibrio bastinii]|uniref:hypothetical protein n=1 Tax=Maridesulfovibrio bastinii TaxID=47157 RepID=UPI000404E84E|nr:hypothetical protein [Maridesulfovibrio bastinii]
MSVFSDDIALAFEGLVPRVAANGELILSSDVDTGLQDVLLRLSTPLGTLFYDTNFGSLLHEWIKEENSLSARIAFEAEVVKRLQDDPLIVPTSPTCNVVSWNEAGITAQAQWQFIDINHCYNLVFSVGGLNDIVLVVRDVSAR